MKSKLTILIAAFAILISFAFITVNKNTVNSSEKESVKPAKQEVLAPYAMEDQNQWD